MSVVVMYLGQVVDNEISPILPLVPRSIQRGV